MTKSRNLSIRVRRAAPLSAEEKRQRNNASSARWRATHERKRSPLSPEALINARDRARAQMAAKHGYAPPPLERDCPLRTAWCWSCGADHDPNEAHLDHDHVTGEFRGWNCSACNGRGDDIERLKNRTDYLERKHPWQ
jgi:hypothetical protein